MVRALFSLLAAAALYAQPPLKGEWRSRLVFDNPYANIPAQCYIETSGGTQNACLFCHTNAPARAGLGNNNPQAGLALMTGDLQQTYAFGPASNLAPSPNINRWENTLFPEKLEAALKTRGIDAQSWDMAAYVKEANWPEAYAKRGGDPKRYDGGTGDFRLFPGLDPADLPADRDGFVRSGKKTNGFFKDAFGHITGWRAINFMPYGIFTPHTGSVSGIYLRLDQKFMRNSAGVFDLNTYKNNLDLLERAIQDRLLPGDPKFYFGQAASAPVERGLYPIGTEFAHPLHYVDLDAPGTRAARVKEVRYLYKYKTFYPGEPAEKEENAPLYLNEKEGWADNGAGWLLSGFIEDANGALRPQNGQELMQCIGCHSDRYNFEPAEFVSGTGNTIDSTWAFPRKFPAETGWREMDYLGYDRGKTRMGDPINRKNGQGELGYFLAQVVGADLYGVMPESLEVFMARVALKRRGYSGDWPALDASNPAALFKSQQTRQKLMRELAQKKEYLDEGGLIRGVFLYPSAAEAEKSARNYRKVVATQRFDKGKEVFDQTPFTYRYHREKANAFTHLNGAPYRLGEVITDRPYDTSESIIKGVGTIPTLIDPDKPFEAGGTYDGEYLPLLAYPLRFTPAKRF